MDQAECCTGRTALKNPESCAQEVRMKKKNEKGVVNLNRERIHLVDVEFVRVCFLLLLLGLAVLLLSNKTR